MWMVIIFHDVLIVFDYLKNQITKLILRKVKKIYNRLSAYFIHFVGHQVCSSTQLLWCDGDGNFAMDLIGGRRGVKVFFCFVFNTLTYFISLIV